MEIDSKNALREIERLRMWCLAHRFLYHIVNETAITDADYDKSEKKLLQLLRVWPEHRDEGLLQAECPSKTIGSDLLESYPIEVRRLGIDILEKLNHKGFMQYWGIHTSDK